MTISPRLLHLDAELERKYFASQRPRSTHTTKVPYKDFRLQAQLDSRISGCMESVTPPNHLHVLNITTPLLQHRRLWIVASNVSNNQGHDLGIMKISNHANHVVMEICNIRAISYNAQGIYTMRTPSSRDPQIES